MGPLIEDLRFCIGAFFVIVGGLLTVQGLIEPAPVLDINLTLWTGLIFLLFGGAAVTLSLRGATFGPAKAGGGSRKRTSGAKAPHPGVPTKSPGPPRSFSTTPSALAAAAAAEDGSGAKGATRSTVKSTAKRARKPSRGSKRK
jgi:hypothetical protein